MDEFEVRKSRLKESCDRPPSMVIVVELDAPASVYLNALSGEDEAQLRAWIHTQPRLCAALNELGIVA